MDPPACEPLLLIRRIRQKQLVVKRNGDDTTEVNEDECNSFLSDGSHCTGLAIDSPGTLGKERQTVYNFQIPNSEVQRRE